MKYIIYLAIYTYFIHAISVIGTRHEAKYKLDLYCDTEMKYDRTRDECRHMMWQALNS